jgi:hypothetical protein
MKHFLINRYHTSLYIPSLLLFFIKHLCLKQRIFKFILNFHKIIRLLLIMLLRYAQHCILKFCIIWKILFFLNFPRYYLLVLINFRKVFTSWYGFYNYFLLLNFFIKFSNFDSCLFLFELSKAL